MKDKKYYLILIFIFIFFSIQAQKEGNIWYFGHYAGLDFNSGSPVALTNSAMDQYAGCASISNSNGELLFYTDGVTIWNSSHQVMDNGTGLKGGTFATQSAIIIKKPASDSLYYVFTVPEDAIIPGIYGDTSFYSLIDINHNGGSGMVVSKNNYLYSSVLDKLTAVSHENGVDVWVVVHEYFTDAFYSFLVTSNGINLTPVISNVGSINTRYYSGYMRISSSGTRLANAVLGTNPSEDNIEIFDFDRSTGIVSNTITVFGYSRFAFPYGVEFSPDESKLYFTALGEYHQVDLSSGIEDIINASLNLISPITYGNAGALQIGPDQKIYSCDDWNEYLHVINNPNELGSSCNFVENAIYLGGKRSYQGLPTFNQSYFSANITYQNECLSDTTFFELSNYSTVQSVTWDFGDPSSGSGNTSTDFYPGHVFTSPGNYIVTANIMLTDSTSEVSTIDVIIYDFPQVLLGADTVICDNDQIILDAGSGFVSYLWNTGETTQTIAVNSPGFYHVMASTDHCSSFDTISVYVQTSATANAGSDESICQFESFDFSTSTLLPDTINCDSLRWIGGAGVFNNSASLYPIYIPDVNETGSVILSLVAYRSPPCSNDTSSMVLSINEVPNADFSTVPASFICVGEQVMFVNNNNTGITSWTWDFGDGSALVTGQDVSHTYSLAGTFIVTLVVSNANNCNDTINKAVVVNGLPTVDYTYNPNDSLCANEIISFTDHSSIDVVDWSWDFDDGNLSSLQNPNHSYQVAGNYQVKLRVTDLNTCADSIVSTLIINPKPDPDFNLLPGDTVCALQPITLNGFDLEGTVIGQWVWDFGDGTTGMGQSTVHSYTDAGDYTIALNVVNNNSCSAVKAKSVHIRSLPVSDFTISPNDTSCMGEIIDLAAIDISGDVTQWNWEFGDGNNSSGQNVAHTYNSPISQNYSILSIYQNANGCLDTTIHQRRVEKVTIDFSMVDNPTCLYTPVSFESTGDRFAFTPYNWDFGDGSSDVGIDRTHFYSIPDTVDVILNVCSEQVVHELIINPICQVTAGNDTMTCQDVYFNLSRLETPPTASNFDSILWFTTGVGHFDDPKLIAPTYFPDPSEGVTQNDTLILTMVGYGLDPCGNDTSTMQLVVIPGASAHAGSDEISCFGEDYNLKNSMDSAFAMHYATLLWSTSGTGHFVDPNAMQPIYVPGPGEIGPVTLTVVAANIINCDSIDEMVLTIRPTYEIPVDITVCYYDSVFAQGSWQYTTGTYFDTLHTANYGCDSVIVTNLVVRPKIDHDFDMSSPSPLCQDESITFTPTGSASIIDQQWIFGDGGTSTLMSPTYTYHTPGDYLLIYHYTDENGCTDSITKPIRVNPLPDVDFTTSSHIACMDTPIDFMGSSTSNIISWDWDFGDGQTASGQNVTHSYSTWGDMTITLMVTDQNGCTETSIQNITIVEPVIVDFSYTIDSCLTVHFIDESTPPPGYYLVTWDWDLGDGNTHDDPDFSHHYAAGGLYNVTLTVTAEESTGHSCTNTITLPVIVPHMPTIYYTWDPEPTCLGDSTHFYGTSGTEITEWYWNFGDGLNDTGQGVSHLY
ncbi:MAG: PKD domain-containing protein, partial [Bacteroidales bacterium]|nr:PKD domain-containing protein [Bacteroidales bacterium]